MKHAKQSSHRGWSRWLYVIGVLTVIVCHGECDENPSSELEKQLSVLSKQVTALLERREEDLKSIEDSVRRSVYDSEGIDELRKEVQSLRLQLQQATTTGGGVKPIEEKNDRLTVKWLSNVMTEMKTELNELQSTLNSSMILQNHEQVTSEFSILRSDITNINSELENARKQKAKYEAELSIFREEINSLRDDWKHTAIVCGKTKNELKSMQIEWSQNWKLLTKSKPILDDVSRPSRHHKYLKHHLLNLEKTTKSIYKENYLLKSKLKKLEQEIDTMKSSADEKKKTRHFDRIEGVQIANYVERNEIDAHNSKQLHKQQTINTNAIENITKQLTNFDKLHLSMLELLENVENIENKVDKNFPEFRKEISKLEVQVAESTSTISLLKENQKNIRDSLKAIGFSVSTMQDKTSEDHQRLETVENHVKALEHSNNIQNSKLHSHILKEESSTANLNATKSTIHLVEELRSFESEYKSIVNKLPRDCSTVDGDSGIYLISPGDGEPILARCENGWTVVQKRYDGSVDFNRKWNEYGNGFGSATGEHWLGNRNLHHLTANNCTSLQINMKDIYGKYWQANYDDFRVADYTQGFKLAVYKYHGNASDALNYQNQMEFSTVDNDRDISETHCANNYEGGWWFSHCQHANLNGRYNLGLTWFDSSRNEWIAVASSEMKVKRRDVC